MKKLPIIIGSLCCCGCHFPPLKHPAKNHALHTNAYILSNGWHTSIILPCHSLNREIPSLTNLFPNNSLYYEIGWGDADFYQYHNGFPPISMVFRSLFASRASVIHLSAQNSKPLPFHHHNLQQIPLYLTEKNLEKLTKFVAKSFTLNPQQIPIYLSSGQSEHSAFFASPTQYHWYFTCNTWTATALQQAGYNIHPRSKLTASSITSGFPLTP